MTQAADQSAGLEPYPLEYFALRAVVSNVTVSPDGKHLAMLKILTKTGNPILHVYDTSNLDKDPFVVDADPMEITGYYWASDDHIVMTLRQQVRDMVKRQEGSTYSYRLTILDLPKKKFKDFDVADPAVENLLVHVPDKIIISERPGAEEDLSLEEPFRPRAYYEMDLNRGTKSLLIRGKLSLGQIEFDSDGNPRFARGYDRGDHEYVFYYRDVGEKSWRDIYRIGDDNFDLFFQSQFPLLQGFDDAVPGNLMVLAFNGNDKLGLWSFNPATKHFDELLYRRSDVDVVGVRMHSNSWTYPQRIVGVGYFKDNYHFEYFDEIEGATYQQLEQLIPHAWYVSITSRSRDGNTLIARNIGPHDPGTYYMLHDGVFKDVGSQQPLIDGDNLADVEYFQYQARDGRDMAGFMTIPKGGPAHAGGAHEGGIEPRQQALRAGGAAVQGDADQEADDHRRCLHHPGEGQDQKGGGQMRDNEHPVDAEPVHRITDEEGAGDAAHQQNDGKVDAGRDRQAGALDQRRNPEDQGTDGGAVHGQDEPDHHSAEAAALTEQVADRLSADLLSGQDEACRGRMRRTARQAAENGADAAVVAAPQGQDAGRFRQQQKHDAGQQDGHAAAEDEHRPPAEIRNQMVGDHPRQRRTDGEAAVEHDHRQGAVARGREFGRRGNDVGQYGAQRQTGKNPPEDEGVDGPRGDAEQRGDAEGRRSGDHQPPAPVAVRNRPDGQIGDGAADDPGGKDDPHHRRVDVPAGGDGGAHIGDGVGVVALENHAGEAEQEDGDLEASDAGVVEQAPDVECVIPPRGCPVRFSIHVCPPLASRHAPCRSWAPVADDHITAAS